MPWYIYSLLSGSMFYAGVGALVLAVLLRGKGIHPVLRSVSLILSVVAIALIIISAAALPFWWSAIWAAATLAWIFCPINTWRRSALALECLLLLVTAGSTAFAWRYTARPAPVAGSFPRLYVVGDSISSGIGAENGEAWPALIAADHHVEVVDYSRAGSTIAQITKRISHKSLAAGLVFLEIGGNDMLSRAKPSAFAADLEALVVAAEGIGRKLVMLELPLLPFYDAYGIAQRRVCRQHSIPLIPRRFFVDIIQARGCTVDEVHLSAAGQERMAEMVWSFIGASLQHPESDVAKNPESKPSATKP